MTSSLIFIIITTVFLYGLIILITIKHKGNIKHMTGMMAAMTTGMIVGLLCGLIVGIILSGSLFLSTVLGMGVGMVVGGLVGIPFSALAFLDGFLSGLMGGMMGAMLGDMIPTEYQDIIIKVQFVISTGVLITLMYMLLNEITKKGNIKIKRYLDNPLMLILAFTIFFFSFNSMDQVLITDKLKNGLLRLDPIGSNLSNMHGGHSTDLNEMRQEQIVVINANEFSYSPTNLEIPKGKEVTIILKNKGEIEHDIQIDNTNVEIIDMEPRDHNHSDNSGLHIHALPKEETKVTLKILDAGEFQYYCTLPGHKDAGMTGTLEVF